MFEEFKNKENLEKVESQNESIPELPGIDDIPDNTLTAEEASALDSVDSSSAKTLLEDDKNLSDMEDIANSTTAANGPDGVEYTVEGGRPCSSGCAGSTWCYGSGDFR